MTSTPETPRRSTAPAIILPLWQRVLFAVPVLGWMARDILYRGSDNIPYAAVTLLTLWVLAILQFGVAAVILPMLALVPVCIAALVLLTRG